MKKLIVIVLLVLAFACGPTARLSWTEIGSSDYTQVELCRDTVSASQLDSVFASHDLRSLDAWTNMKYYNSKDDVMNQYVYTCGEDTLYTVTNHNDDNEYIFTMRVNKY